MPTLKLTESAVKKLHAPDPTGKQQLIWDTELKGFGVLISGVTTSKSYVAQRALPDGRVRRVTVGAVNEIGLDKARDMAADLLNEMRHGKDPKAQRRSAAGWTLRRALEEYLKARKDLRPQTAKDYRGNVERHLAAWLDRPLASITSDMVEEKHREIQAAVERRRREAAKKAGRERPQPAHWLSEPGGHQANATFRVLRILWNFVSERDPDLPKNPVSRLRKQWYAEPRRERVVRAEELPAFYRAVCELPSQTARDYLLLLLFTGLRRSEAAALQWSEIDFAERVIRLPAKRTKAKRRLDLPMTDLVRDLLVSRRAIGRDGPFVFPADSQSGHIEEPSAAFEQIAAATGIVVSAHDLRRVYITVAESTDISVAALKALANHSLGTDVTAGYIQMTVDRLREPAQRIAERLKVLCRIKVLPRDENIVTVEMAH